MAMKLKAGADLCDMQILNFCIHNAQNDKSAAPVGYKYLNTLSSNTNAYLRERIYVGGNVTTDGWRTAAYLDDLDKLDVASNEDFKALKEKVELLAGDTDTDTIISNMKEVSAFLSGFAEDADLMTYLTTQLGSKADKTELANYLPLSGGTVGDLKVYGGGNAPFGVRSTAVGSWVGVRFYDGDGAIAGNIGVRNDAPIYVPKDLSTIKRILHEGNYSSFLGTVYAPYNAAGYLPLTGGTINGSGKTATPLIIATPSMGNSGYIKFTDGGSTTIGHIGFNNKVATIIEANDTYRTIIHSGNIRSQSVNYATSAGYSNRLVSPYSYEGGSSITNNSSAEVLFGDSFLFSAMMESCGAFNNYAIVLNFSGYKQYGATQLAANYNASSPRLAIRNYNQTLSGWTAWREIAFLDSNVASATKLETARTIWGQSFDGTGNVNGKLYIDRYGLENREAGLDVVFNKSTYYFALGTSRANLSYFSLGNSVDGKNWNREMMTFTDDGNVGIGTTNPLYKLHVTGDTYITGNLIVDGEISGGGAAEESTTASGGANIKTDTIATGLSSKTITHNLDTEDVVICIYEKNNITSKWDMILTDVRIDSANAITVTFGSATTVEHKVVIIGE